jgi:hypothetical protein
VETNTFSSQQNLRNWQNMFPGFIKATIANFYIDLPHEFYNNLSGASLLMKENSNAVP